MAINPAFLKTKSFLTKSFKHRMSYLCAFISLLLFNGLAKLLDYTIGDADGVISGQMRFAIFDINIILSTWFLFSLYFKSSRISDINIPQKSWIVLFGFALLLRVLMAALGHNFDLESYEIVADIVINGDSVYANTTRYNYGPIWAYLLAFLKLLASIGSYNQKLFHELIVICLFIAEVFLYRGIYKQTKNNLLILLLLFNPISIVIIGHHSQFDILAICMAYYAYLYIKNKKYNTAILLLGISYSIKHIMVFFPLMLLFNQEILLKERVKLLTIPALIFVLSFMPFYNDFEAIKTNVLSYQFNNNQTFLKHLLDLAIPGFITKMGFFKLLPIFTGYKFIWLLIFPSIAYYAYKWKNTDIFNLYLLCIVATSLAISEQYFLIPLIAVFAYRKYLFSWIYIFLASYYILFVSFNNTSKYFSLKSIGIALDFEWYQIGFAQVQMCLFVLLFQILYRSYKQSKISN
jgi:hypothetical protein